MRKVVKFDVPTQAIQSQTISDSCQEIARDKLSTQATHDKVPEELDPRKYNFIFNCIGCSINYIFHDFNHFNCEFHWTRIVSSTYLILN